MGRILIGVGIVLIVLGVAWPFLSKSPLGRLPGDFLIQKKDFTFYFPLATSLLLSVLLSLLLWVLSKRS